MKILLLLGLLVSLVIAGNGNGNSNQYTVADLPARAPLTQDSEGCLDGTWNDKWWAPSKSISPTKYAICHGTASASNPFTYIQVDENGAVEHLLGQGNGHGGSQKRDDIWPMTTNIEDGCRYDCNCEKMLVQPPSISITQDGTIVRVDVVSNGFEGDETLLVYISGVPSSVTLSTGTRLPDSRYELHQSDFGELTMSATSNVDIFKVEALAEAILNCDNTRAYSDTLTVNLDPNIDCVGEWVQDTSCSVTCGVGSTVETYSVSIHQAGVGASCPHNDGDTRQVECTLPDCPIIQTKASLAASGWSIEYAGNVYDEVTDTTKFNYSLTVENNAALGFITSWILGLSSCSAHPIMTTYPTTDVNLSYNSLVHVMGLSWSQNISEGFSKNFDVVVKGHVQESWFSVVLFGQTKYIISDIQGPSCNTYQEVPQEIESSIPISKITMSASSWAVSFLGSTYSESVHMTEFKYRVDISPNAPSEQTLQYWVLGVSNCPTYPVTSTAPAADSDNLISLDMVTMITGLKWSSQELYAGTAREFKVLVHGYVGERLLSFGMKGTGVFANGQVVGPACLSPEEAGVLAGIPSMSVPEEAADWHLDYRGREYDSQGAATTFWYGLSDQDESHVNDILGSDYDEALYTVVLGINPCPSHVIVLTSPTTSSEIQTEEVSRIKGLVFSSVSSAQFTFLGDSRTRLLKVVLAGDVAEGDIKYSVSTDGVFSVGQIRGPLCASRANVCGQSGTVDSLAPIFVWDVPPPRSNLHGNDAVNCEALPVAPTPRTSDDCSDPASILFDEFTDTGVPGCFDGVITRRYSATDAAGNTAYFNYQLTSRDNIAPSLEGTESIPFEVSVEKEDDEGVALPTGITATDNCDPFPQVIFQEESTKTRKGSIKKTILTRIWTAVDACGNSSPDFIQTVTIFDDVAPKFTHVPDDIPFIECDQVPPPETKTCSSNDSNADISVKDKINAGEFCDDSYTIERIFTVKDKNKNSRRHTQKLNVVDTTPPQFAWVPEAEITVDFADIPDVPDLHVTDNCDPEPQVTYYQTRQDTNGEEFILTRHWESSDACGNTNAFVQTINVWDMNATCITGGPYSLTATSHSHHKLELTGSTGTHASSHSWSVTGGDGSEYASIILTNGQPSLIFDGAGLVHNCVSTIELTLSIESDKDDFNILPCTTTVTVTRFETTPPTFTNLPDDGVFGAVECSAVPNPPKNVKAVDFCGRHVEVDFEESTDYELTASELAQAGEMAHHVEIWKWIAVDSIGNVATQTSRVLVLDSEPPTFSGSEWIRFEENLSCEAVPEPCEMIAIDACDDEPSIHMEQEELHRTCLSAAKSDQNCASHSTRAVRLPGVSEYLSLEDGTAHYFDMDNGDILMVGKLVSDSDESVRFKFSITLQDPVTPYDNTFHNYPPRKPMVSTCYNINGDWAFNHWIFYTTLRGTLQALPGSKYEGTVLSLSQSQHSKGYVAQVGYGASGKNQNKGLTFYFDWELLHAPNDQTLKIGNDNGSDKGEAYFDINACKDVCANNYAMMRTWIATDHKGNFQKTHHVMVISDTSAPRLVGIPGDELDRHVGESCNKLGAAPDVVAVDNCDGQVEVQLVETHVGNGLWERTWSAVDDCGNEVSYTQQLSMTDKDAPVLTGVEPDLHVSCDEVPTPCAVTAVDACDGATLVEYIEVIDHTYPEIYFTPTVTGEFAFGSTSGALRGIVCPVPEWMASLDDLEECNAIIQFFANKIDVPKRNFKDGFPGVDDINEWFSVQYTGNFLVTSPGQHTFYCNSDDGCLIYIDGHLVVDNDGLHATRERSGNVELTAGYHHFECKYYQGPKWAISLQVYWQQPGDSKRIFEVDGEHTEQGSSSTDMTVAQWNSCPDRNRIIVRTWTSQDSSGNQVTQTQQIIVTDTEAPRLIGLPSTTEIKNVDEDNIPVFAVTGRDNCDESVDVLVEESQQTDDSGNYAYILIRKYTAIDSCGLSSEAYVSMYITQVLELELIGVPEDVVVECDDVPVPAAVVGSGGVASITYNEVYDYGSNTNSANPDCVDSSYTITRSWTGYDNKDKSITKTQLIVVRDLTPPTLMGYHENIFDGAAVTAVDNCDTNPTVLFEQITSPDTITYKWTASDVCGNSEIRSHSIAIEPVRQEESVIVGDETSPEPIVEIPETSAVMTYPDPSYTYVRPSKTKAKLAYAGKTKDKDADTVTFKYKLKNKSASTEIVTSVTIGVFDCGTYGRQIVSASPDPVTYELSPDPVSGLMGLRWSYPAGVHPGETEWIKIIVSGANTGKDKSGDDDYVLTFADSLEYSSGSLNVPAC